MPKHVDFLFGGLLLALLCVIAGCTPEVSAPPPEAPKVTVMPPLARELTDFEEFNGWLQADETVQVRARVRGHIQKVRFGDGQIVNKGDPLFELDARPFEADVGRAKDRVKIYEAQKGAAVKDEARLKLLQKTGGASVQQVEKAEADVLALEAQIGAAKNDVKRAELDLEYSRITADIHGRVSKAELTEGNLVNAGGSDPVLTTIVKFDPIRVYFNIDERSLQRYAKSRIVQGKTVTEILTAMKGTKAAFTFALDGDKEFRHSGTLAFGDNKIDPSTGTLLLYGTAGNKDGAYIPGGRVRVRLAIGKAYKALLVPETSILADQDKRYILIADDKNAAKRRNVLLGTLTDDAMRAVRPADKLADGEQPEMWRVIVDNLQRTRLNYPVEPQQPPAARKAGP